MKPEEPIFADALELPESERPAFLERACGNDPALRARVDSLLRAYTGAGAELEASPVLMAARAARVPGSAVSPDYIPGMQIGRYKLLQQLGEGGCGVVYMAEQREPVRRRVAVKVIKLGMDTREVIARFEAERQALALMDHPNIARVLDAGATETGRPYFVMELVHGVPITRHCDEQLLGADERLQLFIQVCHAIQHAHQKGIIHRDLKPSNILVTMHDGVPVPKIIDFGIAKATQGHLTDKTLFTAFERFIGTPAYMSPEQTEMSGLDVDTRTDIYSLGVLLYELLAGRTPFESQDLRAAGLDEMRRMIREKEPARPSSRVSTLDAATGAIIARQRGTELAKLRSWLRGDLDWIVMRCLEKDRKRRYETANALAMDIQRHLANEPVMARPPGTAYVLRKLIRRNQLTFAASAAIVATLALGLVFSMLALQRESAARTRADTEAARSTQVARFMQDMLAGVRPQTALGRDTKMLRAILDETVERLPHELRDQPEIESSLRETLGNVYRDLGELRGAVQMHETSLKIRQQIFGTEHLAVATSEANLGETYARQHRLTEAETMLRSAMATQEKLLGKESADAAKTRAALDNVLLRARQRDPISQAATATGLVDQPSVIRLCHAGGRSTGQTYNSGTLFSSANQMEILEREFSSDGIRIEWLYFPSNDAIKEAISRGEVDFSSSGAFTRIAGLDYKLLMRLGTNGGGLNYLVVRADAPFGSLADLKGRRLATVRHTVGHLSLCQILERHGFRPDDFEIILYESAAALAAALQANEVDGYYMSRPHQLVAKGMVKIIHNASGEIPDGPSTGLCVAGEFERRYPAIVQRVVTALVKLAAWHCVESNRPEILAIWAKAGRDREEIEKSWAAMPLKERYSPILDDYYFEKWHRTIADQKRFGLLDAEVSLDGWAEPKYLNAALTELKLEKFWSERDADGKPKVVASAGHTN